MHSLGCHVYLSSKKGLTKLVMDRRQSPKEFHVKLFPNPSTRLKLVKMFRIF